MHLRFTKFRSQRPRFQDFRKLLIIFRLLESCNFLLSRFRYRKKGQSTSPLTQDTIETKTSPFNILLCSSRFVCICFSLCASNSSRSPSYCRNTLPKCDKSPRLHFDASPRSALCLEPPAESPKLEILVCIIWLLVVN